MSESVAARPGASLADGLVLAGGVVACSTSVLFIKGSQLHPATLACGRLVVAAICLGPFFLRDLRRYGAGPSLVPGALWSRSLWPGVALGTHLITWNMGARLTTAANASLVVNMVPLATPLLLLAVNERLTRREGLGTLLGLAGVVGMSARDLQLDREHFVGDLVCFGAMLLFAVYLVLGRRSRELPSVFLYVVPVYSVAALTCAAACLWVPTPLVGLGDPRELGMVLGLALLPTVLGHSALNYAMGRFRGQAVSVSNLAQPLSAAVLAFVVLGEVPDAAFYLASVLILAGAASALGLRPR